MDYARIWKAVRSRWLVAVIFAVLGIVTAVAYHQLVPAQYGASAEVLITPADGQSVDQLSSTINVTTLQANNMKIAARSDVVLVPVIATLGLAESPAELASQITTSIAPNTSVLSVRATSTNPQQAATVANAIVAQLQAGVDSLVPKDRAGFVTLQLQVIDQAVPPTTSSTLALPVVLLLGLLAGLALGVVVAVALAALGRGAISPAVA